MIYELIPAASPMQWRWDRGFGRPGSGWTICIGLAWMRFDDAHL